MSEKQESAGAEVPPADTLSQAPAADADADADARDTDADARDADDEFPVEVDGDDADDDADDDEIAVEVEGGDAPTASVSDDADGGDAARRLAELETQLAAADEQRQQLEAEKKDLHDRLLRAAADLENFRRRSRKEIDDGKVEARSKVLREMLPVIDNLDRAVEHAQQTEDPAKAGAQIVEGVQLVLRQFAQALERFDVTLVEAHGQPFDPNVHEAIAQAPATEDAPAGTVVSVMQKGYTIGARLLRPSMVVVATGAPPAAAASDGTGDDGGEVSEAPNLQTDQVADAEDLAAAVSDGVDAQPDDGASDAKDASDEVEDNGAKA